MTASHNFSMLALTHIVVSPGQSLVANSVPRWVGSHVFSPDFASSGSEVARRGFRRCWCQHWCCPPCCPPCCRSRAASGATLGTRLVPLDLVVRVLRPSSTCRLPSAVGCCGAGAGAGAGSGAGIGASAGVSAAAAAMFLLELPWAPDSCRLTLWSLPFGSSSACRVPSESMV